MKDEVEDFLRRVAQMRAQAEAQAKGQQPRPAPPQKPPPRPPRTPPPPARLVPARQELAPPPLQAEIVDAELADTADRLGDRVRRDLRGSEEIAEHTRHLGEEVDLADDKMEAHLHAVFDHKIGQLKSSSVATALVTSERSASELSLDQVRRMLRSPESIRDAVILSEILNRPVHLW